MSASNNSVAESASNQQTGLQDRWLDWFDDVESRAQVHSRSSRLAYSLWLISGNRNDAG